MTIQFRLDKIFRAFYGTQRFITLRNLSFSHRWW